MAIPDVWGLYAEKDTEDRDNNGPVQTIPMVADANNDLSFSLRASRTRASSTASPYFCLLVRNVIRFPRAA